MDITGAPQVLARERAVPDAVRLDHGPVLPAFPSPYSIRVADPTGSDPALLAEWMARPHLVEAWDQDWPEDKRRENLAAQLAGTFSLPCIISYDFAAVDRAELGVREIGYTEFYRPARDVIGGLYHADPRDMGFHIATADTSLLGKGVMSTWIKHMVAGIAAADPLCPRIMGDPDSHNKPIRRAFEKLEWTLLGEFDVRADRRIALYMYPLADKGLPELR